jgi:CheY-like chemotaxis protein
MKQTQLAVTGLDGARPRAVSALIIDDDRDARELLASIVEHAGHSVVTARDGREALDLLHTVRPSVILLDLSMPGMNGAEFREAQRRHREWIRIPTVVMTGSDDEPLLDLGIEATLQKPLRARESVEIVRRYANVRVDQLAGDDIAGASPNAGTSAGRS